MAETNVVALTEGLLAIANTTPEAQSQSELRPVFEKLLTLMQRTTLTPDEKIRVLRTFEVAAAQSPSGVDPEIKKQVYAALVKQLPSAPPAGHVGAVHEPDRARRRSARSSCSRITWRRCSPTPASPTSSAGSWRSCRRATRISPGRST